VIPLNSTRRFILSATDFSPAAIEASKVAAKLALRRSESLRLIHVSGATTEIARGIVRSRLDAGAQRLREIGVEVETLLLETVRPPEALLERILTDLPTLVFPKLARNAAAPVDNSAE
jgi:nucleotide-binding universal stress UspA family protein